MIIIKINRYGNEDRCKAAIYCTYMVVHRFSCMYAIPIAKYLFCHVIMIHKERLLLNAAQ